MTVTFESMGFSDKNVEIKKLIYVFSLRGKFSVALGDCKATCAAPRTPDQSRRIFPEGNCSLWIDQAGIADDGKDSQ